jgi:uncharacterized membrane protein
MTKDRLEAFSDGVLAIIITIMVLELKVPHGMSKFTDLLPILPVFLSYLLSYLYIGIYWNNHHHMIHVTKHINGTILLANLHLLFWLSLVPFVTAWMGENFFEPAPTSLYGFVLLMSALAYYILQYNILKHEGEGSLLAKAIGNDFKGKISPVLYLIALPLSFYAPSLACFIYLLVALIWILPDRRIESALKSSEL